MRSHTPDSIPPPTVRKDTDKDLSGEVWSNADVSGSVFVGCQFTGSSFDATRICGARFTECTFTKCTFTRADLSEATFTGCTLGAGKQEQASHVKFSNLKNAVFRNCNLNLTRLEGCDLLGVEFHGCVLKGADFRKSRFYHSVSRSMSFASAIFESCKLDYADLSG